MPTEQEKDFIEKNKAYGVVKGSWKGGNHPSTWTHLSVELENGDKFKLNSDFVGTHQPRWKG